MNYGALLRSKRMECGLLQEDLAKKMGVSQRTISSWETGRTVPDLETYNKLSAILGCSISELTGQKFVSETRINTVFPGIFAII